MLWRCDTAFGLLLEGVQDVDGKLESDRIHCTTLGHGPVFLQRLAERRERCARTHPRDQSSDQSLPLPGVVFLSSRGSHASISASENVISSYCCSASCAFL